MVSRFIQKSILLHLTARYLKGTLDCGILFPAAYEGKECRLMGYTNSSWCGDAEDNKSTVGYVFMLVVEPFAWSSRKESVVELLSCEVGYIDGSLYACQEAWMMNLVDKIEGKNHGVLTMRIDNMFFINLAKNLIAHGRRKHIEMRFQCLRVQVTNRNLYLEHRGSENQIADIMTKVVQVICSKGLEA